MCYLSIYNHFRQVVFDRQQIVFVGQLIVLARQQTTFCQAAYLLHLVFSKLHLLVISRLHLLDIADYILLGSILHLLSSRLYLLDSRFQLLGSRLQHVENCIELTFLYLFDLKYVFHLKKLRFINLSFFYILFLILFILVQ